MADETTQSGGQAAATDAPAEAAPAQGSLP
jgi:hypothetical protein